MQQHNSLFEDKLIFACCSHAAGYIDTNKLLTKIHENLNFDTFLERCEHHRSVLLVNNYLITPHSHLFPNYLIEKFKARVKAIIFKQLEIIASIKTIHLQLQTKLIPHVFLKGPVLSSQLYAKQLLRYSADIDLLVSTDFLKKAHECLYSLGYETKTNIYEILNSAKKIKLPSQKDAIYTHPKYSFRVELHWKTELIECILSKKDDFWYKNTIKSCAFQGINLPVFPDMLNVIYLCFHASKHSWLRAHWLTDIVIFIKKQNIKLGDLLIFSAKYKLQNLVKEAFFLAYYWLEIEDFRDYAEDFSVKQRFKLLYKIHIMQTEKQNISHIIIKHFWNIKVYPKFRYQFMIFIYNFGLSLKIRYRKIVNLLRDNLSLYF